MHEQIRSGNFGAAVEAGLYEVGSLGRDRDGPQTRARVNVVQHMTQHGGDAGDGESVAHESPPSRLRR